MISDQELAHWRDKFAKYQRETAGIEDDPSPLQTNAEVIGYIVAFCRASGLNEEDVTDHAELFVHLADLARAAIREAEKVLRQLGYGLVSARLKQLAPRARKPKPHISTLERVKAKCRARQAL